MKTTLDPEDIEQIAQRVTEIIGPILAQARPGGDPVFDVAGLAKYLLVKKPWVYQKVHSRDIPYYKVGKYPRFRKSKIDEWLEQLSPRNEKKR